MTWRLPTRAARVGGLLALLLAASGPLTAEDPRPRSRGAVVPIRGVIDDIMRDSLERRLTEAQDAGATVIILELDTPGGMVSSTLDICRMIKNIPPDIRTVAWVHPQAYSAGAMIAVACHEIWMSPSSSIGDCAPIMVVPLGGVQELGGAERAKAESPILQEFRDSAARNGYDPLLSRAMVVVGEVVWWIERLDEAAERRFVGPEEKKKLIDEVAEEEREWRVVESYDEPTTGRTIPLAQPVVRSDELLTMSQFDAVAFGFARGIVTDLDDLAQRLGLAHTPVRYERSGWEKFAAWLNSPVVRGILLVIVLVGGYLEFQSPGLILPGATALIALAIFLAAPYAAGLANIWTLLILAIGVILIGVELFVLPGFGFVGLLGGVLIAVGILATFVPQEPALPTFSPPSLRGMWEGLLTGMKVLSASILVSLAGIALLVRYLPRSRVGAGVVLANPAGAALALDDAHAEVAAVGDIGVVTGALRPGGQARFGQEIVDVTSQGEYVEAGRRVQVIRRQGMRIEVRPLPDEPQS